MTRWLPIKGFEGRYEISEDGQVKVLAAPGRGRLNADRVLKIGRTTTGYPQVLLYSGPGRRPVARRIHHLVLEHFVGPRPAGAVGRHLDDNPLNNSVENLAWGDQSENTRDMVANGNHNHARKSECKWGHPLDGDNLIVTAKQRSCRACARRRHAAHQAKTRGALAVFAADNERTVLA